MFVLMNYYAIGQNSKAMKPHEKLDAFAFIIGQWDCDINFTDEENKSIRNKAIWTGRYILNGNAIEDEYRETNKKGELIRLGLNIRSYHPKKGWTMKWFDVLNSTWLDLGPKELGGVIVDDSKIIFKHYADQRIIVRITFYDITQNSFSWKADVSNDDEKTWQEKVFTIEAKRIQK